MRVISVIVLTDAEGEIQLEKYIARKVENVSPSSTSSRGVYYFLGFLYQVKNIVEAILSKSLREFSDTDQFFIGVSLNPITKQFPTIINIHSHINCRT